MLDFRDHLKDWTLLLEKQTATDENTLIFILNAEAISAKKHRANSPHPPNNFHIALSTLKSTFTLPANHEHRKLLKDTTAHSQAIHESWHQNIDTENIPTTKRFQLRNNYYIS